MEKKMENEMETGVIKGLYRDPSIQIIPTLGAKVYKYYLHWAIWIPRGIQHLRKCHDQRLCATMIVELALRVPGHGGQNMRDISLNSLT